MDTTVSQGDELGDLLAEPAASGGEKQISEGAAPVALDGVGGVAGAGEEEGEGMAKVVQLLEVKRCCGPGDC